MPKTTKSCSRKKIRWGAPHFENDNLEDRIQMRCDLFALTANQLHRIGDAAP